MSGATQGNDGTFTIEPLPDLLFMYNIPFTRPEIYPLPILCTINFIPFTLFIITYLPFTLNQAIRRVNSYIVNTKDKNVMIIQTIIERLSSWRSIMRDIIILGRSKLFSKEVMLSSFWIFEVPCTKISLVF